MVEKGQDDAWVFRNCHFVEGKGSRRDAIAAALVAWQPQNEPDVWRPLDTANAIAAAVEAAVVEWESEPSGQEVLAAWRGIYGTRTIGPATRDDIDVRAGLVAAAKVRAQ